MIMGGKMRRTARAGRKEIATVVKHDTMMTPCKTKCRWRHDCACISELRGRLDRSSTHIAAAHMNGQKLPHQLGPRTMRRLYAVTKSFPSACTQSHAAQ